MAKKTSAAQKRQQARMKQAMKIAKQIHKANPRKKWTTCVKEAWRKV